MRVVSIYGFGGVGKTALAHRLTAWLTQDCADAALPLICVHVSMSGSTMRALPPTDAMASAVRGYERAMHGDSSVSTASEAATITDGGLDDTKVDVICQKMH